jgi:hypothetical protein
MSKSRLWVVWIGLLVTTSLGLMDHLIEPRLARDPDARLGGEPGPYPSDWFAMQRAFPGTVIDQAKYRAALEQARVERANLESWSQTPGAATSYLSWIQAGPYNIGGRVTSLAVVPDGSAIYLGSANGGVFKSVNGGRTGRRSSTRWASSRSARWRWTRTIRRRSMWAPARRTPRSTRTTAPACSARRTAA